MQQPNLLDSHRLSNADAEAPENLQTDASALVKPACRQAGTCFGLSQALWCAPPVGWTVRDAELITEIARFAG